MYDTDLMYRIVRMYYENDMNQNDIARKVFVSRSMVSRILKQAKELGIVEINIKPLYEEHITLEKRLKEYFPNCEVNIAYTDNSDTDEEFNIVCNLSAAVLQKHLDSKSVFALSRGKTVANTINKIKPEKNLPEMQVVQLCGSLSNSSSTDEINNIQSVGNLYGCKINKFYSPLILDDKSAKNIICKNKDINEVLKMSKRVNVYISTVDTILYWKDILNEKEITYLVNDGAVGCIFGYFYDINGEIIESSLYDKMVIPNREIFDSACTRICVANDRFKTKAIFGALKGGLCNHLITNSKIASRLVDMCENNN